ncbi:ABC transporter ATP-binding protein [Azospirillum sp. RWY-5-1]|uniref:ABC transporter ATP-binding protein n=1 Tax=Azospirillum oleiclasticum TaxID=2735135 RepID=A0ABX2T8D6_9PROT|nr:ABC transporter ATP-binding protein [Azospirillum oleiclasticum]NYZ13421.1 ABC transporter ATP-binding protein [Azospirillum oleiclasticum]NYZ20582.1 ABC transporter ATP-binding protein [Azospirillum oleiclasticum]
MLEITDLHAHYGLSHVLQGVTLTGAAGEVVSLFGRNGVGKTTIIKTIAGWVRPTSGSIRLDGADIGGRPADRICRMGLGIVPEDRRIFPGLSVLENLELGLHQTAGRSRSEKREALDRVLERFPRLKERRAQMGTTLSGGEQQMLAMARVMVGAPRVLLIDEPTEGLAPMIVDEIFGIITTLRDQGLLILLVEQNVHRAIAVTSRFYAIERGQVVFTGSAANADDRERLFGTIAV